jgi:methylglutamate dehydrogenase subunit C
MSTTKDFVGKVLAQRPGMLDPNRPQIAGFRPRDRTQRLFAGAHLLPAGAAHTVENDEGVLTSVAFSPSLNHWIGIGLLVNGPKRIGKTIRMVDFMRDSMVELEVCSPIFVDPWGERLRV